jgi:hypothetical protein
MSDHDGDGYAGQYRSSTLTANATRAVLIGNFLPAHDEVFDLAEHISIALGTLHAYIRRVRDTEQADNAVRELLDALRDPQYIP